LTIFSLLQRLELGDNKLEELPESIVLLGNLQHLLADSNRIASLPSPFVFEKLVSLSAKNNRLTELPASFKECWELEVLNLTGNPLKSSFWYLVSQLPKLRELSPQP
jgi:Leucine-rich repeat (LRR) protein